MRRIEQHLDSLVGVQRLVDFDAGIGGEQRHPEKAVMGGSVLAGLRAIVRGQHDEEAGGVRVHGVVDQRHAHGVGHHGSEYAVGGKGGHGPETAGQGILRDGRRHHGHVLFRDTEADSAAQRIRRCDDAVNILGFAGENGFHQVARAQVEERGPLHGPGKPGFGGFAGGDGVAFAEHQLRRQHVWPLQAGVVGYGPAGQRDLHAAGEFRLGRDAGGGIGHSVWDSGVPCESALPSRRP